MCVLKCKSQKELPMLTFGRHNHCKLLPITPQVSGSCGILPLRIGLRSTTVTSKHTPRRLSFYFCSTSALPIQSCCEGSRDMPPSFLPFLSSLVVISHSDTEYSATALQKPSTSPFPLLLSPNLCIQAGP